MSNGEIYRKTLVFSVKRFIIDLISLLLYAGICVGMFLLIDKTTNKGLIGLGIGIVFVIIIAIFISRFVKYNLYAGQIAMITRGVTENSLPDDVYAEGKRVVKERFVTVAVYFAATNIIKGIFRQIGNLITKLGNSIGGDTGGTIGSVISTIIQIVISYLCDCCLGWVFYRKDQSSGKATCEGAVIFFKHGKTLLRNMGRIFGMGLVSLAVIGGVFFGIAYLILSRFEGMFEALSSEIVEIADGGEVPAFFLDSNNLALVAAAVVGLIIWDFIHSTFIRPFVLTGVLRNYIASGINDIPTEDQFAMLDSKSPKFAKLHQEI